MIALENLLRVPYVDVSHDFDLSPDGTRMAFSWNRTGRWELYELPLPASDAPRPASVEFAPSRFGRSGSPRASSPLPVSMRASSYSTSEGERAGPRGAQFAPKYSPDGAHLAYAVDFDGSENFHLFVHDFESGADTDLTPKREILFALQPNFCWSPDGTEIAFLSNQSGNFDAYVMPARGGPARCVLSIQRPCWDVRWSPDGKWLAVAFESSGQDYGVYLIPLDGGEAFPLADENGPLNAHQPAWSPEGRKLAFYSDALRGWHQIGILDIVTKSIDWLTEEKVNCLTPCWSPDGSKLAYVRARGAADELVVHSFDGQVKTFQVESGVHYKPRFTPDGGHVIIGFSSPRRPPDLWQLSLATGQFTQLTHSLPGEWPIASLPEPQEITYPGMDGTPIPALLFASSQANEHTPGVVVIHGGPNWHYQREWHPFMTHLASRGWTVLAPNYRGSTGYGRAWQTANRYDLGGVDTDDVVAGAHFLIRNKLTDPANLAVTGRSHGGYLTLSCLTRYPELWAVGAAVVPFMNWFTCHERSRDDLKHWDIEMMGDPQENYALWRERSPYFFLDRLRVPLQLICGAHDPRCPAEDSIQARDKLLELGKEVDFHLYEGEGHGFLKIENVIDAEVRRVAFLARVLESRQYIEGL